MIRVIAGGKKSKDWVLEGQNEYEKRLKKPFDVHFEYFDEEKIANLQSNWPFKSSEYVILLDERGENISSPELSERLEKVFISGKSVAIIIGAAYGVSEEVRTRADFVWSVSKLVFPHELMRVILAEQIYRAQEISRGGKYHHL
ncbi:23S rRNA (pseudouridine(1915)-N(3))-methyltransferase RlmH [Candidatus Saccharibacteria bacterium]|nr:23S rRNA (pseudouridine(1915)-N(3))-methyltransferase RlmH [Candidatus Saccharibacteria bacterium]MBQ9403320.1 23S rRNA (pseudouridine(1915)-N(3))-methyltransferase RlmH [Candidatus Saccharibacteria bacterium]